MAFRPREITIPAISPELFRVENGDIRVTHHEFAQWFDRRPDNIAALIKTIIQTAEKTGDSNRLNFKVVDRIDAKGERRDQYVLGLLELIVLVTKLTGEKPFPIQLEVCIAALERWQQLASWAGGDFHCAQFCAQ